jgi:PAS domain-containing protein
MLGAVERSQAERHEREARLRLLVERMPAILWTTDANLRFTSSLGAGLEAFDLRPNQLTGMALSHYYKTNRARPADRTTPPRAAGRIARHFNSIGKGGRWKPTSSRSAAATDRSRA